MFLHITQASNHVILKNLKKIKIHSWLLAKRV
jgi:hypothetical protein